MWSLWEGRGTKELGTGRLVASLGEGWVNSSREMFSDGRTFCRGPFASKHLGEWRGGMASPRCTSNPWYNPWPAFALRCRSCPSTGRQEQAETKRKGQWHKMTMSEGARRSILIRMRWHMAWHDMTWQSKCILIRRLPYAHTNQYWYSMHAGTCSSYAYAYYKLVLYQASSLTGRRTYDGETPMRA